MKSINLKDTQSVILLSDIHFGVRNASLEWIDNMTGYMNNFFIPLITKQKEIKPNSILIIAGDYFDNRQSLDLNVMNVGFNIMQQLAAILPVYIITGNHDVYKKNDNSVNSLRIFQLIKNVHVITENTVLNFNKIKFLLFPWTGDLKKDTEVLMNLNDIDYAIMHEDIKSLNYDNGRQIVTGLDVSSFKGKKIYSGHIHKRQVTDRVTYIGAPYQLRRSDIGNDKGVYILDVDGEKLQENFYINNYSPKFLKLRLENILDLKLEDLRKVINNNYVDIIIRRSILGDVNLSYLLSALDTCNAKKIEIILDNSDIEETLNDHDAWANDLTVEDIVKAKVEKMNISDEQKHAILKLNERYLAAFNETING